MRDGDYDRRFGESTLKQKSIFVLSHPVTRCLHKPHSSNCLSARHLHAHGHRQTLSVTHERTDTVYLYSGSSCVVATQFEDSEMDQVSTNSNLAQFKLRDVMFITKE